MGFVFHEECLYLCHFTVVNCWILQWRHNECDCVSNHRRNDCLLSRLLGADQRMHQRSASLAFMRGIHWWPVNSPHKWPVLRKILQFDEAVMKHRYDKFRHKMLRYNYCFVCFSNQIVWIAIAWYNTHYLYLLMLHDVSCPWIVEYLNGKMYHHFMNFTTSLVQLHLKPLVTNSQPRHARAPLRKRSTKGHGHLATPIYAMLGSIANIFYCCKHSIR